MTRRPDVGFAATVLADPRGTILSAVALVEPGWLWWLIGIVLAPVALLVVPPLFALLLELGQYLLLRFLASGSAEYDAVRDGHPSRAHLAGRHRPLKRWAPRCQHCFEQYEEQRRQERRQARGEST
ncbi:hypothetical protein ADK67_42090 [Saccharothrix sp. NRRL B-16348]|uniref:hypothetical protein n=1 Tax=Saccharothrix sp. NRRL B-16348 TaxID=1415542 RepID=UPI0006B04253|nr:hypothetical protein [Saccharothrix sp. NRRL B-16348]KOX14546.1 hypothetical protein ADK67_42090 [Saccharothrix sp. NRRL B-16348]